MSEEINKFENNNEIINCPEDLDKNIDQLIEEVDWSDKNAMGKVISLIAKKLNGEDPQENKRVIDQGNFDPSENSKGILERLRKLIQSIHIRLRYQQTNRFEKMQEQTKEDLRKNLELCRLTGEAKQNYMKRETKYTLFQADYTQFIDEIYEEFYNIALEFGQFFNDTKVILKNKDRSTEKISRHSYFSLKTGQMEPLDVFYTPKIEYGEPKIKEYKNGLIILDDKAIKMGKQGTTAVHKTELEKRGKLVDDLNQHESFTYESINKFNIHDFAEGLHLDKSHDWKIKDSEVLIWRSVESWINELIIYQELSLGVGEIMKYQYIKNFNENKEDIEMYLDDKKYGTNNLKDKSEARYRKIERYVERAKFDPYIGGVMEGLEMKELREPRFQNCLVKRLGGSKKLIAMRLSESTWQVDKRRVQFRILDEENLSSSKTYMVKFSDFEKKIFDVDSLLNMLIKVPMDSFAYLLVSNYVMKPTDEKETWMGLDHFMSTPLNLKNQFIKTTQLLEKDKFPVHRNTSDVEFFILSLVVNAQKAMDFNHLAVLFKPRKRQGNVNQLVECFEAFGLERHSKPERRYITYLIKLIRKGFYDDSFDFHQIKSDLTKMTEVSADQLMGQSSSNHMEIEKYFSDKYKDVIAVSGHYHSMKTSETVAELLKEDFSHLKLSEILGKLENSCLVRIFIKEMMGGMRDIAILSPQWKVGCAISEELAKRISENSSHDLIQKERAKAEIISDKIRSLEQRFEESHNFKGRLLVLELDYTKWNAHQWTDILGEVSSELANRAFGYVTSSGEYLKSLGMSYMSKMMQIELKRLGSAVYAHLAMIEDQNLLKVINLTDEDKKMIAKMNASPSEARKEWTGENMQKWIESALRAIDESTMPGQEYPDVKLNDLILLIRCPHGMGQGIFSTQSSLFGTVILQPILDSMMFDYNVNFWDFVETSDDGNIYMIVPNTHRLVRSDYQQLFVEELNYHVNKFGLSLSIGKVKWDINGSFCFNSSDYDTTSIEYLSGLPAKVECMNRLWKGFGSLQYGSPFELYLRNSTWLIFLKNSFKIKQSDMTKIARWMKVVRDYTLRNNLHLPTLTAEQTELLYCTVPSVEVDGEIFFTNRKEVEMLIAMSQKSKGYIDLNHMENLMRESTSSIGFTFKNPKFDVTRKMSESTDLLIARESGFDGQVKMLSHLAKMKGTCETFASYYRVLASPWIDKDGMKVQLKISSEENGLLSNYASSLASWDSEGWDHNYGFFVEDNDTSKPTNKKMSCEIFKNVYTNRVEEGEESELLIQTLSMLDGVDNDYLTKNLSAFIVPLSYGVFHGQKAMPVVGMNIKQYLEGMNLADPWVLPQNKKFGGWANYGVLCMEDTSDFGEVTFKVFVMQDKAVIQSYQLENGRLTKKKFDLPSPMSKYTWEESDEIADSILASIWSGKGWLVSRLTSILTRFDIVKMRKARLLMSDSWDMFERHQIISGKGTEYTYLKRRTETSEE